MNKHFSVISAARLYVHKEVVIDVVLDNTSSLINFIIICVSIFVNELNMVLFFLKVVFYFTVSFALPIYRLLNYFLLLISFFAWLDFFINFTRNNFNRYFIFFTLVHRHTYILILVRMSSSL
jgi:hypothetical protein